MEVISVHEVRVFRAFEVDASAWSSSREVAAKAAVAARTARAHITRFVNEGLLDVRQTFPGYRYRVRAGFVEVPFYQALKDAEQALEVTK